MFLGCQKIEYHAKYCNIDPRKKGFRKTLPSLERPLHVLAERELNEKLRIEEEKEEKEEEEERRRKRSQASIATKQVNLKGISIYGHCTRFFGITGVQT